MNENNMPSGTLYAYDGRVTIDGHLSGLYEPVLVLPNLIPTAGRAYLVTEGSIGDIDTVKLGADGTTRAMGQTDLFSPQFAASPTDMRVSGTKRIVELFVGVEEANGFMHREIGFFAGSTLISTLRIVPEFEKTSAKTRTYIYSIGWD